MGADVAQQALPWAVLALCLWPILVKLFRRWNIPEPVGVAAALSWLVARIVLSLGAVALRWVRWWIDV